MPRRATPRRSTRAATARKMNAAEVLARLNEHHSTVIFPNMFERLTFANVFEVEYHFHVDKPSDVIYLTKSVCFFAPVRSPSSTLTIEFQRAEGALMGEWIAHVVNFKDMKNSGNGILGFTANLSEVEKLLDDSYEAVTTDQVPDRTVVGMGAGAA